MERLLGYYQRGLNNGGSFDSGIESALAFILVSAGVWVMRRTHPDLGRPFRCPMVPVVPILAIGFSGLLIVSLSYWTQLRLLVWLVIGLIIYFTYSVKHSKVRNVVK